MLNRKKITSKLNNLFKKIFFKKTVIFGFLVKKVLWKSTFQDPTSSVVPHIQQTWPKGICGLRFSRSISSSSTTPTPVWLWFFAFLTLIPAGVPLLFSAPGGTPFIFISPLFPRHIISPGGHKLDLLHYPTTIQDTANTKKAENIWEN